MEWAALLDWEESVFRSFLSVWKRVKGSPQEESNQTDQLEFEAVRASLSVVAQALTGEPVRVGRARGLGGLRGSNILIPARIDLFPSHQENRTAYLVQVVVSAGVFRLTQSQRTPPDGTFESALESLILARRAAELMATELPAFAETHDRVMARVLDERRKLDVSSLSSPEKKLEHIRQVALGGGDLPELSDPIEALVGPRTGRHRSPEVMIWGTWFEDLTESELGIPTGADAHTAQDESITTEVDAPDVDALRLVDLDADDCQDPPPNAPVERAESLDSYNGGARDLDGTDELQAQLDALEQVELGDVFRGSEGANSLLKANLDLGLDVSDAKEAVPAAPGIPYDEWDLRAGQYRKDWCTVYPAKARLGDSNWAKSRLRENEHIVDLLESRLAAHRAGLRSAPRQLDGEDIDLEAVVDDLVARKMGHAANPRIYRRNERRRREFATTILLDVSMSTDSWISGRRVLDVVRESALVLGEVAHRLGDRIQVLAFASETRNRCHVWEAFGFGDDWNSGLSRIAGLTPQGYTRIGPALRHASAGLANEPAERRLLLLISDGKPTDYDRYEGRYGIADVRRALREAERCQITPHALAIDSVARDYLPALFGKGGWHVLPSPEDLVEVLTEVYGKLTAS